MNDTNVVRRARKRINEVKKKVRPDLNSEESWTQYNFANNFQKYCEFTDNCDRICQREVSERDFNRKYEHGSEPVVITGTQKGWKAILKWTPQKLTKKYRNQEFKCGEDSAGNSVKIKMKYYIYYMLHTKDDSPLSIVDSNFGKHSRLKKLLNDYEVPYYFRDDVFKFSTKREDAYRWFSVGPARSGADIHVDPSGTCAWSALVHGQKRWCLFPPHTPKEHLEVSDDAGRKYHEDAITWFWLVYPMTKLPSWPTNCRPIEILQKPGETVFIPSGWSYVVLNLDTSMAITQKFYTLRSIFNDGLTMPYCCPKFSRMRLRALRKGVNVLASAGTISKDEPSGIPLDCMGGSSSSSTTASEI